MPTSGISYPICGVAPESRWISAPLHPTLLIAIRLLFTSINCDHARLFTSRPAKAIFRKSSGTGRIALRKPRPAYPEFPTASHLSDLIKMILASGERTRRGDYRYSDAQDRRRGTHTPIGRRASQGSVIRSQKMIIEQHVDSTLISNTSPAFPGQYLILYLSGMGGTAVPVASGNPSPSTPLAHPVVTPVLTLNGQPVPFDFVGLTPGTVGSIR